MYYILGVSCYQGFQGESPNGTQRGDFSQDRDGPARVRTKCACEDNNLLKGEYNENGKNFSDLSFGLWLGAGR
jgi:hypothetical protein